ncbi:MAG: heavy metal translocating P-type ATPase [Chromatiales bacterium]|jgi:Cd2+/Zn2+-exporting ATPase|nr:heavy metal translocating P-type ATPase [Chromatiales bacterium]
MNQAATAIDSDNPIKVKIVGMDCGSCAMTIENSMQQLPGVQEASVSFTTESMEVTGAVEIEEIESRLRELGYRIADEADEAKAHAAPEHRGLKGFLFFLWEQLPLRMALMVTATVLVGVAVIPAIGIAPIAGVPALSVLFGGAVLVAGAPVFMKGFHALIFARRITIDLLMAIASIGAIGIGETGEAVTVILLFMLGEALEAYSAERARDSLRTLMSLQPQEATVLQAHTDSHGHDHGNDHDEVHEHSDHAGHDHGEAAHDHQVILPVEEVNVGDRVLVRPAQRIPVDGEVVKGISSVNQAPVTGEDIPVLKEIGDEVMAGTVNGEAALELRVTRPSSEGTIARIAKLVEQAQAQRSPAERFIDRFARWYTPAVVVLATLVVAIPVLLFGQAFLDTPDGTHGWLYRGLTLLIIACPCALVISIPVTVVSGLTRLAQLGVLVKSGALLDRMADVVTIAFDKTGTLTYGRPSVTSMLTARCDHPADAHTECAPCDDVVVAAASVERASEHPVAHAIVEAASSRGAGHIAIAKDVQAHPGKGVSGVLQDGARVSVGSRDLFDATQAGWKDVAPHADVAQDAGQTVMYVSRENKVIGYIGVQDEIRKDSEIALAELANMTPPVRKVMLTGDNPQAAQRAAGQIAGIDEVHAGLLPDEKLVEIEKLGSEDSAVAMVGDGINDAPALARADIGIAMGGGGTAQAMETADVVLMQDDLSHVPLALRMARKSRQIIKQNIMLSLGLKLIFLALAIPGIATLWMAVIADVGATLLVTLNGMRMLRQS